MLLFQELESLVDYQQSLSNPLEKYKHRYRSLYRNGACRSRPWRADLRVWSCPDFSAVDGVTYKKFHKTMTRVQKIALEQELSFRVVFRRNFSRFSSAWNQTSQWDEFKNNSPNHILSSYRGGWFHDSLLTEISHPYMRLIRTVRLGVSELASHTHYMNLSQSSICPHFKLNHFESLNHFFFECPAYSQQRAVFIEKISPILDELGLPNDKVSSFLGFPQGSASKRYFQSNRDTREKLYLQTCRFMEASQRFRFV